MLKFIKKDNSCCNPCVTPETGQIYKASNDFYMLTKTEYNTPCMYSLICLSSAASWSNQKKLSEITDDYRLKYMYKNLAAFLKDYEVECCDV